MTGVNQSMKETLNYPGDPVWREEFEEDVINGEKRKKMVEGK